MATEIFKITSYEVKSPRKLNVTAQGIPVKFPARILCRGKKILVIVYFLDDSSPMPDNIFLPQHKCGTIFIPLSRYDRLLTMLQSEDPVYCYLNSHTPHKNCFSLDKNLSENRKYPDNGFDKTKAIFRSYGGGTFSTSDSYGQQRCLVTFLQDKRIKTNNGGINEPFNGNYTINNRTFNGNSPA